jgi:hypothetical protein
MEFFCVATKIKPQNLLLYPYIIIMVSLYGLPNKGMIASVVVPFLPRKTTAMHKLCKKWSLLCIF